MTDLELDALAEGVFKYLVEQTDSPLDAVSILGMCLLKVFARACTAQIDNMATIDAFAEDFRKSLVESFNSASAQGTETRQ